MNKKFIYGFAALASVMLASCKGDYDDWKAPQSNAQEADAAAYGIQIMNGDESTTDMDDTLADDNIKLVKLITENKNITGYTLRSFTINDVTSNGTVKDDTVIVSAKELTKQLESVSGTRARTTYSLNVTTEVAANLKNGDAVAIKPVTTTASFTTATPPAEDEKGYYLLGNFVGNDWDASSPIWMEKTGDGIYSATVTTSGDGSNWYKFYQGSHFVAGNWDEINKGQMGCAENGCTDANGFIVWQGDPVYGEVQTPVIKGAGSYVITIDVKNMVYSVAPAYYFATGNVNGWNASEPTAAFFPTSSTIHTLTTKFYSSWDLKVWNLKDYGNWNACLGSETDGCKDASGALISANAQAISSPEEGWYTFTIDIANNTYKWEKIANQSPAEYSVTMSGDFNSWGDTEMTQIVNNKDEKTHIWYKKGIALTGGCKFKGDPGWATNWGAADFPYGTGVQGGDNIPVEDGTYDVYFNDITGQYLFISK